MRTVVALYDRFDDAQRAVRALRDEGFNQNDINLIANDVDRNYARELNQPDKAGGQDVSDGAQAGAGIGAVLGGLGGLLLGLGALAIPGIGPVLVAGPIVAGLAGAGVGAITGGIIGALVDLGIPDQHAQYYAEGIRRGGTLVTVGTDDERAELARQTLNRFNPVDIENRTQVWQQEGWRGYDPNAEPYHAQNVNQEAFMESESAVPVTGSDVNDLNRPGDWDTSAKNRDMDHESNMPTDVHQGMQADSGMDSEAQHTSHMDEGASKMEDEGYIGNVGRQDSFNAQPQGWEREGNVSGQDMGRRNIPITGEPGQHPLDEDEDVSDDLSGMDQHLRDDVLGSDRSRSGPDIPVTGGDEVYEIDEVYEVSLPEDWDVYKRDFFNDYQNRFASTGNNYDYYQPVYLYGYNLASDERFSRYNNWDEVEPYAQQNYARSGIQAAWDDVKDAVHHAWDVVRGK